MPLTVDSKVHEYSGASSGTDSASLVVSLAPGDATTAGNTLIAVFNTGPNLSAQVTAPSGWVKDLDTGGTNLNPCISVFRKPPASVVDGETSWTFTVATACKFAWYVREQAGLDPDDPVDTTAFNAGGSALTLSTGTTAANPGTDTLVLAAFGSSTSTSTATPGTWSGYTAGFTEVADLAGLGSGGSTTATVSLAVAEELSGGATSGPFSCSATTSSAATSRALIIVYRAADSPITNALGWMAGFEWGTAAGLTGITGSSSPFATTGGALTTNWLVQASSARNSAYGLRMSASAATVYGTVQVPATAKAITAGFDIRMISGSGVAVVVETLPPSGTKLQLVYDYTNLRFGLRWGTAGTVAWQAGTTPLNTWAWVDVAHKGAASATWHGSWRLETGAGTYTDQPSPADLTGQTPTSALNNFLFGTNAAAQTFAWDLDNVAASGYATTYPLGPHVVQAVKVDPAGTPAVSGTVGNFALVTANATGAALTSGTLTSARDALDELPPTISAAADGIVQTTTAASDYIEFPMDTFTVGPSSVIAAVKLAAPAISTTGPGGGTMGIRGWDGTTETVLQGTGTAWTPGNGTAPSLTVPAWSSAMWNRGNGWTQAALDQAALRFGYSTDATPDMGVHALYLEVATRPALTARQITMEDDTFTCDVNLSPYSSASVSYIVTSNHATRGVRLDYSIGAVPQTGVYVAASSSSTVTVAAEVFGDVDSVTLTPDPAS